VVSSDLSAGTHSNNGSCAERPRGDEGVFCRARVGAMNIQDFCGTCNVNVGQSGGRFITNVPANFPGQLPTAFSCMATLGTTGCGFEHPLGALRKALTNPENGAFIRPEAYLAFVIITDEEDCTGPENTNFYENPIAGQSFNLRCILDAHTCGGQKNNGTVAVDRPLAECQMGTPSVLIPVPELVQSIIDVKKDPNLIIAAGIFGWPVPGQEAAARYRISLNAGGTADQVPTCSSQGLGDAVAGFRVKAFVESFPQNSIYSICQGDFREAMQRIGEKIRVAIGEPCVTAPLVDTNTTMPGMQADCTVVDRVSKGVGEWNETPLPQCKAGETRPCWNLVPDQAQCATSGYKIEVDRKGTTPPAGTQQAIRCLTCVKPGGC
jgi:hypothetical protein